MPLSLDPVRVEVCHGVGRPGWAKLAGAVRSSTVVVPYVLGEYGVQMPLAQDHHTVGELGSGCEHEPFGVAVCRGQRGGIRTVSMPTSARTASSEAVNWPARSRTRKLNSSTRSPGSITSLRICWVVHPPSGFVVVPRTWRLPTSSSKNT